MARFNPKIRFRRSVVSNAARSSVLSNPKAASEVQNYSDVLIDDVLNDDRAFKEFVNVFLDVLNSYGEVYEDDDLDVLEVLDGHLVPGKSAFAVMDSAFDEIGSLLAEIDGVESSVRRRSSRPVRCSHCGRIMR